MNFHEDSEDCPAVEERDGFAEQEDASIDVAFEPYHFNVRLPSEYDEEDEDQLDQLDFILMGV